MLNTLNVVFAQNNKGLQTNDQTQNNHKSLFMCNLVDFEPTLSHKLPKPIDNQEFLGYQQFTALKRLKIAIVATGEYSEYFIKKTTHSIFQKKERKKLCYKQ